MKVITPKINPCNSALKLTTHLPCAIVRKNLVSIKGKRINMAKTKCPNCGSTNTIRILYGYPAPEAFLLAEQGKIKLGGCCITESNPEFHCKDCDHEWRKHDVEKGEGFLW